MPARIVEITRREEFCASHRLHAPELSAEENARVYGVCNNANGHGHNYVLEVTLRGEVSEQTGMVADLNHLAGILREEIVSQVDHKHLNLDVPFLSGINPTAENLSVAFWHRLEPRLRSLEGCQLFRIRLQESRDNFVEYFGPRVSSPG